VDSIRALAESHHYPAPNVDLGIGALVLATGMPADAGQTIFAVARMAGWTAHYLEELAEAPLRFRARAIYSRPIAGG
jgi:citrate synthase